MSFLKPLLAFLVVIGTLVVIHELGHYLVARWCGVKVLRFSVGMGKIVWSRRFGRDRTEWAISILPLGGYVKMLDAREADLRGLPPEDLAREFTRQNVWKRIAIVAAGPVANFLLAILLFAGLFMHGIPEPTSRIRATVAERSAAWEAGLRGGERITAVDGQPLSTWADLRWKILHAAVDRVPLRLETERANPADAGGKVLGGGTLRLDGLSPQDLEGDFMRKLGLEPWRPAAVLGKLQADGVAARAGLREGDRVLDIDGSPLADGIAFVERIRASAGRTLDMHVLRGAEELHVRVTPASEKQGALTVGRIGVDMGKSVTPEMTTLRAGPLEAIGKGAVHTWETAVLSLKMIGKMLTGQVSWKNLTGPITIADYAGQTASIGMLSFLSYIAFISISLGVMNLLPIPVLDGGLLLYYSLEVLTGRPLSERVGGLAQRAGLGILVTLMVVAVFNDIVRLIS